VNGNIHSIERLFSRAQRIWRKWLSRRGQRHAITWTQFRDLLRAFPWPKPRVCVQIWQAP
jgi:hypothetical protein